MECLTNYIGIRGLCDDVTAGSGLYINDLPGMSIKRLEGLSDSENADFRAVWDKIYGRAQENFLSDVLAFMPDQMKANQVLEAAEFGRSDTEVAAIVSGDEYRGIWIRAWGSSYLAIEISQAQIYSDRAATLNLHLFDTYDGRQLWTGTASVVAGWNTIQINRSVLARGDRFELFLAYDGNDIGSAETPAIGRGVEFSQARGATVATATTPTEANLSFTAGHTNGMILNWQVVCSIEDIVCRNKHRLKNALRYKAGIEYLIELRFNDDVINRYTIIDRDDLVERIEMMERVYDQEMRKAMQNLEPVKDRVCFECESYVTYRSTLPG